MIDVLIRPGLSDEVSQVFVEQAVGAVLASEGVSLEADLSVVLTDDVELAALNRQFRQIDEPTDVLSFGGGPGAAAFVSAPDEPPYLGDVIVSVARARVQAAEQEHGVKRELALLIVHGVLHLLGYDHATDQEQDQMWEKQDAILDGLGAILDG